MLTSNHPSVKYVTERFSVKRIIRPKLPSSYYMFDEILRARLEGLSLYNPSSESMWYGPWNSILTSLFPTSDGFFVTPQKVILSQTRQIADFVIEVTRVKTPNLIQAVLIVEIKNTLLWPSVVPRLDEQLSKQIDANFEEGSALDKMYWIAAVGPHWRYGMNDGQAVQPLSDWHDKIHDRDSYFDFQNLASLVRQL